MLSLGIFVGARVRRPVCVPVCGYFALTAGWVLDSLGRVSEPGFHSEVCFSAALSLSLSLLPLDPSGVSSVKSYIVLSELLRALCPALHGGCNSLLSAE